MSSATRLDNVQALRGIAAMMVCAYHLAGHTDGMNRLLPADDPVLKISSFGPTGVFVFFVISGFIIPYSMHRSKYETRYFFSFWKKRLWRLHPPYVVTLLLTIGLAVFNQITGKTMEDLSATRILSHFFYLTKILEMEWFNPIFWTLAIEIQYYLVLALAFPLLNSEARWKRALFILLLSASTWLLKDDRFITFYIGPFLMGFVLFYILIKKINMTECLLYALLASFNIYYFVGSHWLIASFFAVFFILYIQKTPRFMNNVGEVSYSLYLTHPLFGGLFIYFLLPYAGNLWLGYGVLAGAVIFSLCMAHFFYRFVERPAIEWSGRVSA